MRLTYNVLKARYGVDVNNGRFCDSAIAMSDRLAFLASSISSYVFIAFGTRTLSTSDLVYVVAVLVLVDNCRIYIGFSVGCCCISC